MARITKEQLNKMNAGAGQGFHLDITFYITWSEKSLIKDTPRDASGAFYRITLRQPDHYNKGSYSPAGVDTTATINIYTPTTTDGVYTYNEIYREELYTTAPRRSFAKLQKISKSINLDALFTRAGLDPALLEEETATEPQTAPKETTGKETPATETATENAHTLDGETIAKYDEIKDNTGLGILWNIEAHHEIRQNESGFFIVYNIDYCGDARPGYRNPYYYTSFENAEKDLYRQHGGSFNAHHKIEQTYRKPEESPKQEQTEKSTSDPIESHTEDERTAETAATPKPTIETAQTQEAPTESHTGAGNYYIENKETGKIELHFEKSVYMALDESQKVKIKSNFLFSRRSGAWVSRRKFPNLSYPRRIAKGLGLYNAGTTGDRLTFEEQQERKAERAEARAERMEARAEKATERAEALQAPINRMHGDIAFFTQPNINSSAGRAFARQRERMWAAYDRGIEEFRKSDYYKERAATARATASAPKDKGFCNRRIEDAKKSIRAQKRNLESYKGKLARIESGEALKRYNGTAITAEEVQKWIEDANDIILEAFGKIAYYDAIIQDLGGNGAI